MSWLATVALSSDTEAGDWMANASYHNNTVDFFDNAVGGLKVDGNGRCIFAGTGAPGLGVGCLSPYGTITGIAGSNGFTVSGGGTYSPQAYLMKNSSDNIYGLYSLTYDSPVPGTTTEGFTILSFNSTTGASTVYNYGRADYSFSDSPFTQMTSGAFDGSDNFYGFGRIRRAGSYEYPFLVKYNSSGVVQWTKGLQPSEYIYSGNGYADNISKLLVDSSGNSYFVLRRNLTSPPSTDYILLKYNSSGVQQWVRELDSGLNMAGLQVTDGTNIYILNASGVLIAVSCSTGAVSWERTIYNSDFTSFNGNNASAVLYDGYLYCSFHTSSGSHVIAKVSTSGTLDWGREISVPFPPVGTGFQTGVIGDVDDNKMYFYFEGPTSQSVTTFKLPTDGSKTGTHTFPNLISYGGSEPYSYTLVEFDILYADKSLIAATTSGQSTTSTTWSDFTPTIGWTKADVTKVEFDVSLSQADVQTYRAPSNIYNPVTIAEKRDIN